MHQTWIPLSLELCHTQKRSISPLTQTGHGSGACHIRFILRHLRYGTNTLSRAPCLRIPKILEAIGAKQHSNRTKLDPPGINYQDSVSAPLSKEADNDAATQEGEDKIDSICENPKASVDPEFILPAVDKESAYLS